MTDVSGLKVGLRVNPGHQLFAFRPGRPGAELFAAGRCSEQELDAVAGLISGVMFHFNCENDDFENFAAASTGSAASTATLLKRLEWVSLGGGLYFTKDGYPLDDFCAK